MNYEKIEMLKKSIRTVPDFPKEGIMFRDITTLINNKETFKKSIKLLAERYENKDITHIAGIESRGFIFGAALAYELNLPFVTIRKKGKLPCETLSEEYELEYGKDSIEIDIKSLDDTNKVIIVDDLIATGGTALAACNLVKKLNAEIEECCFIIDLPDLNGTKLLKENDINVFSLVQFKGD